MKLLNSAGVQLDLETLTQIEHLAIYPGSFNPLHKGHHGIYQLLVRKGYHVVFEISKTRYQKAPYSDDAINTLISQFKGFADLLISEAPLFRQKQEQLSFINPHWVMGFDTAKRWIEVNRAADASEQEKIDRMNVIFLGRLIDGIYYDPHSLLDGTERYTYHIYHYHCDMSSTQLRHNHLSTA